MWLENRPGHHSRLRIDEYLPSYNSWCLLMNIISVSFYGSSHRKDDTYTIIVYNSPASAAYKHTLLHLVVSLFFFFSWDTVSLCSPSWSHRCTCFCFLSVYKGLYDHTQTYIQTLLVNIACMWMFGLHVCMYTPCTPRAQRSQFLVRMWRKRNTSPLLVGLQAGTTTLEISLSVPQKMGNRSTWGPSYTTPGHTPRRCSNI